MDESGGTAMRKKTFIITLVSAALFIGAVFILIL